MPVNPENFLISYCGSCVITRIVHFQINPLQSLFLLIIIAQISRIIDTTVAHKVFTFFKMQCVQAIIQIERVQPQMHTPHRKKCATRRTLPRILNSEELICILRRKMKAILSGNSKMISILVLTIVAALMVSACTAAPSELENEPDADGEIAGFWQGLWHGFISPFTFIISLFSENLAVYEVHNNGNWYVFGFLMGASIIFGGSGRGSAAKWNK